MLGKSLCGLGIIGAASIALHQGYKYSGIGIWKEVERDEIVWAWLKAEARNSNHQFVKCYKEIMGEVGDIELNNPSFSDTKQNEDRMTVFNRVRGEYYLWKPIHENTKWYRTKIVINNPFRHIYGPYPPKDVYSCDNLDGIILWGHEKKGPFIVLEGNHRWYGCKRWIPFITDVYVGLSEQKYALHATCGCERCIPGQDNSHISGHLLGLLLGGHKIKLPFILP